LPFWECQVANLFKRQTKSTSFEKCSTCGVLNFRQVSYVYKLGGWRTNSSRICSLGMFNEVLKVWIRRFVCVLR
jgi:hypothetical protein